MIEAEYCSWCNAKTMHMLVKEHKLTRNDYRCLNCGKSTVMCRVPSCHHMAKRTEKWSDEFCAEDDGSLYNTFEYLEKIKISQLDQYKTIFVEGKNVNYAKWTGISMGILGVAAVFIPFSWMAAPELAAAIGTTGLLGATASGEAIAGLGGGALVSASLMAIGPGGMVGGVLTIAAAGTFIGGSMGAYIAHQYLKDVDFSIDRLPRGTGKSDTINLFINGFLTENDDETNWKNSVFDDDENYLLTWESSNLKEIGKALTYTIYEIMLKQGIKKSALKGLKGATGIISWPMIATEIINNPWHKTVQKTGLVASILSTIISKLDTTKKLNIYGHSLACAIIVKLLNVLSTGTNIKINNVILLGGATSSSADEWQNATKNIKGRIYNCYSTNDLVLKYLYQIAQFGNNPIGRGEIKYKSEKIVNLDVSTLVNGHNDYKNNLSMVLNKIYTHNMSLIQLHNSRPV